MKPKFHKEEMAANITRYLGDCRNILPTLGKVDAVVTDPPYGIAHTWIGGGKFGWGNSDAYKEMRNGWDQKPPEKELIDKLTEMNEVIIWGGNYFELPLSRGWLVWNKPERGFTLAEANWHGRISIR